MLASEAHPSSFRDPSGFIFKNEGKILRQINLSYKDNYDLLMSSGLYSKLVKEFWLIKHVEVTGIGLQKNGFKIIIPEQIPFISYPYEWCFSQLKDAALLTLRIQEVSIECGMSLKDASAYNVQFKSGLPVFIDTLSFEKYIDGKPWVAYRQFCQHFLGPLLLMSKTDIRLSQFMRTNVDGIPLDLTSKLLPGTSKFRPSVLAHIHWHAHLQSAYSETDPENLPDGKRSPRLNKLGHLGILNSLRKLIDKLKWQPVGTEWANYYEATNYSNDSFLAKEKIVLDYLTCCKPKTVWDLGANTGHFSRIARKIGAKVLAFDVDPCAVEANYIKLKLENEEGEMLPLILDLNNPPSGSGWAGEERLSLLERADADCLMALALIHHLAISNNLPFDMIAKFFASLAEFLVIEFVPKEDSQVQRLLASREDIFSSYTKEEFELAFQRYYTLEECQEIPASKRFLFLMRRIDNA